MPRRVAGETQLPSVFEKEADKRSTRIMPCHRQAVRFADSLFLYLQKGSGSMKPPIFSFTAYSGTGKTTYIEKLIPLLKQKGLKVGVIKHDAHDFEIDHKGKDTWRFSQAGADKVSIGSKTHFALMVQRELHFQEIAALMQDMDIILTEGYNAENSRFIAVHRRLSGNAPVLPPETLYAVVTDEALPAPKLQFPLDDPAPLCEHLTRIVKEERHED